MFKRTRPIPFAKRLQQIVWPKGGWKRAFTYIAHRVRRMPGSPHSIAAGLASGVAISCTPFMGLHFILGALIAVALRGNVLAALIGTAAGNPWTFPIIWVWIYTSGCWLLGRNPMEILPGGMTISILLDHPWSVLWPMVVGGIPTAVVAWIASYIPVRGFVAEYKLLRRRRIMRKEGRIERPERSN